MSLVERTCTLGGASVVLLVDSGNGKRDKKPDAKPVAKAPEEKPAEKPAKKPRAQKPEVADKAKPKAKVSPLEKVRKALAAFKAEDVSGAIQAANDIRSDKDLVKDFVSAIETACNLFDARENFKGEESLTRREWMRLPFSTWETMIREKKEGGMAGLEPLCDLIDAIREANTVDVLHDLWELWATIAGPASEIGTMPQLVQFLQQLYSQNLVESKDGLDRYCKNQEVLEKAILVSAGKYGNSFKRFYLPARKDGKDIPIMEGGWAFVKEAEERAKTWQEGKHEQIANLKKSATRNYTTDDLKAGKEGYVFIQFGWTNAALLQCNRGGVRILRGIGLRGVATPTRWLGKPEDWPVEVKEVYRLFEDWKNSDANKAKPEKPAK